MNIKLMSLDFKNFKGIDKLAVDFGDVTKVSGENATGKTTLVDGFMWLLFGKDSKDRKDFEIKTLDENGEALHGLEHRVKGILSVDGREIILERLYKEKWVKERGAADKELKGHTTEYMINEVPQSMKEYQGKINAIFEESKFKLVTSPLYFTNLKWQEQRKLLLEIIGDICEKDIFKHNKDLAKLEGVVTDGIDNFNSMNKNKIKKLKEKVESLPFRIDECNNSIQNLDFEAIEFRKKSILGGISSIEQQLEDKGKANDEKLRLENEIYKFKSEYQDKMNEAIRLKDEPLKAIYNEKNDNNYRLKVLTNEIEMLKSNRIRKIEIIENDKNYKNKKIAENDKLRQEIESVKDKKLKIDSHKFMCPTCNRDFENADIEKLTLEMTENFETQKKKDILEVNRIGVKNAKAIESLNKSIAEDQVIFLELDQAIKKAEVDISVLHATIEKLEKEQLVELEKAKNGIYEFEGMKDLNKNISDLESKLGSLKQEDNRELKIKKINLNEELENVNKELAAKMQNMILKARISDLEKEEKELNSKIIELEGLQFLGEEFVRTKVDMLEGKINKKFNGQVKFKLFKNQINGGLEECCEAMIEGVPFSNVNTASQINGGLSIVNTLSKHFQVQAPIFIDNAESVNRIIDMESQIIKLIVSKDKNLKVEVE